MLEGAALFFFRIKVVRGLMRIEIALEARLTGVGWFLFFFLQKANVNEAVSGL